MNYSSPVSRKIRRSYCVGRQEANTATHYDLVMYSRCTIYGKQCRYKYEYKYK